MKNIEILYSTDVNGIDLLKVSLYSLLKNKNNQTFYNITIAHKNIDTNIINQIHKIIDYFTNVTIRFIDCLVQDQQYGLSNISKAEKNPIKLE
jgi:lipopolysaccharide biosynthesis glycosyltransferase